MDNFASPQGVAFRFNNLGFTATSLSVSSSANEVDVTGIEDTEAGSPYGRFQPSVMKSADVSIEWIGAEMPAMDKQYTLDFGGSAFANSISGSVQAVCTSAQITAQAGELLKGTASFKLTYD